MFDMRLRAGLHDLTSALRDQEKRITIETAGPVNVEALA